LEFSFPRIVLPSAVYAHPTFGEVLDGKEGSAVEIPTAQEGWSAWIFDGKIDRSYPDYQG
jgi:hypothetical protein